MPRQKPNDSPSPKWEAISSWLHQGRVPVDPVRAEWDTATYEETGTTYAIYNFKLGRVEWAYGRIPAEFADDYGPQEERGRYGYGRPQPAGERQA